MFANQPFGTLLLQTRCSWCLVGLLLSILSLCHSNVSIHSWCWWLDRQPLATLCRRTGPFALHEAVTHSIRSHQLPLTVLFSWMLSPTLADAVDHQPEPKHFAPQNLFQDSNETVFESQGAIRTNPKGPDSEDLVLGSTSQHYTTALLGQVLQTRLCCPSKAVATCRTPITRYSSWPYWLGLLGTSIWIPRTCTLYGFTLTVALSLVLR